jgi:hypothetical protein
LYYFLNSKPFSVFIGLPILGLRLPYSICLIFFIFYSIIINNNNVILLFWLVIQYLFYFYFIIYFSIFPFITTFHSILSILSSSLMSNSIFYFLICSYFLPFYLSSNSNYLLLSPTSSCLLNYNCFDFWHDDPIHT